MNTGSKVEIGALKILAVDDHETNREFIRAALAPRVALLELAGSGFEAMEKCRSGRFDIVLMDLHMPDMDGLVAWAQICRQAGDEASGKVIALTADSRAAERERVRAAGFHGFLDKPVARDLLLETISRVAAGLDGFTEIRNPADERVLLLDDARAARVSGSPKRAREMRRALASDIDDRADRLDMQLHADDSLTLRNYFTSGPAPQATPARPGWNRPAHRSKMPCAKTRLILPAGFI